MKKINAPLLTGPAGLYLIIVLAFIIRMVFFLSLQPWDQQVVDNSIIVHDAIGYDELATTLLADRSFKNFTSYRTPGYPVFVALVYSISNGSVWLVLFVQILLSVASVYLVFVIARSIFSDKIALLSALLFAIDLNQAFYNVTLYTDTLFTALFLSSVYFLCKCMKNNTLSSMLISGLFLGVATLVRPISILFPLVAVFTLMVFTRLKPKMKLVHSLAFGIVFMAMIIPWSIHNHAKYGEVKLTSLSGFNLLFWNAAYTEVYKTGKTIEVVVDDFERSAVEQGAKLTDKDSFKDSKIYGRMAKKYIRENFILYCKRHTMGIINMFAALNTKQIAAVFHMESTDLTHDQFGAPGIVRRIIDFYKSKSTGEIILSVWIGLLLLLTYVFGLFGVYVLAGRKDKFLALFLLIILYFSILVGVIGSVRYRMPFMPFINILAAFGFVHFYLETLPAYRARQI